MNTQTQYINTLQHFMQEHGAEYGIRRIGIFGSVARGEQMPESDVDVLVEAPTLGLEVVEMKRKLEETFNKPVDLVIKSEFMRERFKNRIEKEIIYV
jgi:predicted nucleotidyltransferase